MGRKEENDGISKNETRSIRIKQPKIVNKPPTTEIIELAVNADKKKTIATINNNIPE